MAHPKKIAVLGGGGATMSAVFNLTSKPDWQKYYDITVYQLGWRLGGKAATGRNPEVFDRVQEHGVHMMWGNYDNTFRALRALYQEWNRDPSFPMSSLLDGPNATLIPYNQYILGHWQENEFKPYYQNNATNNLQPGIDKGPSGILGLLTELISVIARAGERGKPSGETPEFLRNLEKSAIARALADGKEGILEKILDALEWVISRVVGIFDPATADFIQVVYWIARGLIANLDLLLKEGWEGLDDWDLKDWLVANGGQEVLDSPTINFIYSGMFCNGYKLACGTALYFTLRSLLDYKGSIMYKFKAGMAEAVFSPMYQVLIKRGVKFQFFHRVTAVNPSTDGKTISSISMVRQATPIGDYQPLYEVKKVLCWPSRPWYDQLKEGQALADWDLESYDGTPFDQPLELQAGSDFDQVILGISLGALPYLCPAIIAQKPAWKAMVEQVRTTETFSFQATLYPSLTQLGYKDTSAKPGEPLIPPNINEYHTPWSENPVNNWQDFSEMLDWESWEKEKPENRPLSRAFFEGTIQDFGPSYYPTIAQMIIDQGAGVFWPNFASTNPGTAMPKTGADWGVFWTPAGKTAPADPSRIQAQWLPGIANPSDRYVQALAGTTKLRLRTNQSGYANLFLTGDWIRSPMNLGCFEAAIVAGMQTANAIQGKPLDDGIEL